MIVLPVADHFTFAASLNTSQTRALRQTCRKAPRVGDAQSKTPALRDRRFDVWWAVKDSNFRPID